MSSFKVLQERVDPCLPKLIKTNDTAVYLSSVDQILTIKR